MKICTEHILVTDQQGVDKWPEQRFITTGEMTGGDEIDGGLQLFVVPIIVQ